MGLISPMLGKGALSAGDAFSDPPPGGRFAKWVYGVIVPAGIWVYGICCCLFPEVASVSPFGMRVLSRAAAIAYGSACINAASFLHFHYFWGNVERLCGLADPAKALALLGFVSSLGYLFYHFIMLE